MNYVPGFSNYLQQFARGGRARFDEEMIYDADQFEQPMVYNAEQQYVNPYQYVAPYVNPYQYVPDEQSYVAPYAEPYVNPYQYVPDEQSYVAPYAEPYAEPYVERQFVSPRYNGEDIYDVAPAEQPYVAPYTAPTETPYIPGFSNYLEATVPEYGAEPIMDAPQRAMVVPTTQEPAPAEVPFDPSTFDFSKLDFSGLNLGGLDSLYGMNFASNFGGGLQGGGIYPTNPDLQMFQAPLSNKGNPTAYGGNYISVTSPTQTFRLLDKNTGKVVYEGVGYEGAQEAISRASALTAKEGAKAQWQIQTPDPQQKSGYSVVANEKRNQSTLGDIASFALPIGMAILTGGMSLPAQMAGAAMAGAAGAGLAGKDPLKAGLISGATAGIMGGSGLNKAIGQAVGNVGGTLAAKTAEELGKTAAEKAAEQIIVTGLSKAAQGAGSAIGNTLLSQAVKGGLSDITGYKTPAEKFAEQPLPEAFQPPVDMYAGIDPIDVLASRAAAPNYGGALANTLGPIATEFLPKGALPEPLPSEPTSVAEPAPVDDTIVVSGDRFASGSGSPFAAAFPVPVNAMLSGTLAAAQPTSVEQPKTAEDIEAERNPIVVEARPEPLQLTQDIAGVGSALAGLPALGGLASDPYLTNYSEPYASDIVVTGNVPTVTPDVGLGSALAGLPAVIGALPTDPALTTETAPEKKLGLEDYLRIASLASGVIGGAAGGSGQTGTYNSGGGRLNPIFSAKLPAASGLGTIGATRTARPMGNVDWLTYGTRPELNFFDYTSQANPAPITTPIPEEPRGPSMYVPDTTRFARGGRAEFAVNGPGTGRSDDIPAVLSDGEYVIDAETVALLGDGSSKAGAKKLDELRVKVRKHKGKKLAKGRFSANAKKPEAYLSGGRI